MGSGGRRWIIIKAKVEEVEGGPEEVDFACSVIKVLWLWPHTEYTPPYTLAQSQNGKVSRGQDTKDFKYQAKNVTVFLWTKENKEHSCRFPALIHRIEISDYEFL